MIRAIQIAREADETVNRHSVLAGFVFLDLLEGQVKMIHNIGLALGRPDAC